MVSKQKGKRLTGDSSSPNAVAETRPSVESDRTASNGGNSTLPFLCPLCLARAVQEPVLLHLVNSKETCIACKDCVTRWIAMGAPSTLKCPQCAETMASDAESSNLNVSALLDGKTRVLNCPTAAVVRSHGSHSPNTNHDVPSQSKKGRGNVSSKAMCGICEETAAEQYCVPCGFPLCAACLMSSHQRGRYRTHEVVPLHSAPTQEEPNRCVRHPTQSLDLYCLTCRTCVCLTCCFGEGGHKEHTVELLSDVTARIRSQLTEAMAELEPIAAKAAKVAEDFGSQLPRYERGVVFVQSEIRSAFDTLRHALNEREKQLQRQLLDAAVSVKGRVGQHTAQCRAVQTSVQHVKNALNVLLDVSEAEVEVVRCEAAVRGSLALLRTTAQQAQHSGEAALGKMDDCLTRQSTAATFHLCVEELLTVLRHAGGLECANVFDSCRAEIQEDGVSTEERTTHEGKPCEVRTTKTSVNTQIEHPNSGAPLFRPSNVSEVESAAPVQWPADRLYAVERPTLQIRGRTTAPHRMHSMDASLGHTSIDMVSEREWNRKRQMEMGEETLQAFAPPLKQERLGFSSSFSAATSDALTGLRRLTQESGSDGCKQLDHIGGRVVGLQTLSLSFHKESEEIAPRERSGGNAAEGNTTHQLKLHL